MREKKVYGVCGLSSERNEALNVSRVAESPLSVQILQEKEITDWSGAFIDSVVSSSKKLILYLVKSLW